jgi:hypothetical protein
MKLKNLYSKQFAELNDAEVRMNKNLEELEAEWRIEAERHEAEIVSGAVSPVSGEEAMNRLRARLSQ